MSTEIEETKKETALCIIPQFNEFELELKKFTVDHETVVYDMTNKKQEKSARSAQAAIGTVCANLKRARDDIKKPLKTEYTKKVELLDAEYKRIEAGLRGAQDSIKGQIKKHEDAIQVKAAKLQEKISTIINIGYFEEDTRLTSEQLKARLKQAQDIAIDDSFEPRKGDAALAKEETTRALNAFINDAENIERQAAEAEKIRLDQVEADKKIETERIEKEAKIKAEADAKLEIDKAHWEKVAAEQRAKDAEAKTLLDASEKERLAIEEAERLKLEAQQADAKAKRDAKQAVIDQEAAVKAAQDKVLADQKEADRVEAEALAEREADVEHRKTINNAAVDAFIGLGFSKVASQSAVKAIVKGSIPGVSISY